MPSARRLRVLFLVVIAAVITTLFFTSSMRQASSPDTRTIQDFYHKTVNAMDRSGTAAQQAVLEGGKSDSKQTRLDGDGDGDIDDDDEVLAQEMAGRLRAAAQKAKDLANAKAPNKPNPPSEVIGVGSSAGGQKKIAQDEDGTPRSKEDLEVDAVLNEALKKSPVVIFSKSYCPYSKRAKGILLEKYQITPEPHVVELDIHPLGPKIQDRLLQKTGRRTVPNVMINGISIGGSDDVVALDSQDLLIDKIKELGGKRVQMQARFAENGGTA